MKTGIARVLDFPGVGLVFAIVLISAIMFACREWVHRYSFAWFCICFVVGWQSRNLEDWIRR